jgi:hypothetical protein
MDVILWLIFGLLLVLIVQQLFRKSERPQSPPVFGKNLNMNNLPAVGPLTLAWYSGFYRDDSWGYIYLIKGHEDALTKDAVEKQFSKDIGVQDARLLKIWYQTIYPVSDVNTVQKTTNAFVSTISLELVRRGWALQKTEKSSDIEYSLFNK